MRAETVSSPPSSARMVVLRFADGCRIRAFRPRAFTIQSLALCRSRAFSSQSAPFYRSRARAVKERDREPLRHFTKARSFLYCAFVRCQEISEERRGGCEGPRLFDVATPDLARLIGSAREWANRSLSGSGNKNASGHGGEDASHRPRLSQHREQLMTMLIGRLARCSDHDPFLALALGRDRSP